MRLVLRRLRNLFSPESSIEADAARYRWILETCNVVRLTYRKDGIERSFGYEDGPNTKSVFLDQQIDKRRKNGR